MATPASLVATPISMMMSGCATPSFDPATNFGAGNRPFSVAVGDFNLDGEPDLAVANQNSDNVSVLLNNCTSNTAPTIAKAFNPTSIFTGGSSTVTLTLTNPNASALTNASFTDTLTGLSAVGGAVGGTCVGTAPNTLVANATAFSFSGITIPAASSCTVIFAATSATAGSKTNQTSGVTTTQTPTAGAPSNVATLIVNAPPTGTITDPFGCTGPGDVLNVTLVLTNAANVTQTVVATATPSAGLAALTASAPVSNVGTVMASFNGAGQLVVGGSLLAGQSATISYQVQVGAAAPGTTLSFSTTASFGGAAPITVTAGTINVTCVGVGPGTLFPATSEVSDQKAGSVLIYNFYSSTAGTVGQDTRFSITNIDPAVSIGVHLFFGDGAICSVADAFICLTPNQTVTLLASDLDPGTSGYIVAVASDVTTGCPISFNRLIGDEFIKLSSGHTANLGAEAFAALPGGLPACDLNSVTATLRFDGVSYNRAPRVLALDSLADNASGNNTLLVINRIGGNLAIGADRLSTLFGILYDDQEIGYSFSLPGGACQLRGTLSNNFPRTAPRMDQIIPAGRTGWLRIYDSTDAGILGAALVFNPNTGASGGAFSGGHNLHKLRLTTASSFTIPIFPPNC